MFWTSFELVQTMLITLLQYGLKLAIKTKHFVRIVYYVNTLANVFKMHLLKGHHSIS